MFQKAWLCASTATLLGFATLLGSTGSAQAAFTPINGPTQASYATITGTPGSTGTSFGPYAVAGSNTATISSSAGLERNQVNNGFLDSNFADGTQLVAQCGFSGFLTCDPAGVTSIRFAAPVFGFTVSADDFDTSQSYTFTLTALDASGATVGTLTASSLADNGASPAILSAFSTTGVSQLLISDAPTGGGLGDGDFVLGQIGVPEPSSVAALSMGLLALFAAVRRRA